FFLGFQYGFSLQIIPLAAIDHKRLFQPVQIVINCFDGQGTPLAFEKLRNGVGGKGLAHIFHDILYNTVEQIEVHDIVPLCNIVGNNGVIDSLHDLIGGAFVKVAQRHNGESTQPQVFV